MADPNTLNLRPDEWESWSKSVISHLYPELKGGIFHTTSIYNYEKIRDRGYIFPNTGQFAFRYPQTPNYYGFSKGYISLFDFQPATDEQCIRIHHTWERFFYGLEPFTVALQLSRAELSDKLVPNSASPILGEAGYKGRIPYIEAWYPEPIPFSAIESIMAITVGEDYKLIVARLERDEFAYFDSFVRNAIDQFPQDNND